MRFSTSLAVSLAVSLAASLLAGCASVGPSPAGGATGTTGTTSTSGITGTTGTTEAGAPAGLPLRVELADTPFFPQEQYQCGPASLAMALGAAGYPASPKELEKLVFLPDREGSLQTEMLVAARRRGALAHTLPPHLDALLQELAAGRPVIVLQNLGLSFASRWHYAVAIGYDWPARQIILRSGPVARETMNFRTFGHTWKRSGNWAMVVLPPGQLPLQAEARTLEQSLVALEKQAEPAVMVRYYEAASQRWPDRPLFRMGLGINAYNAGQLDIAESAFRTVTELRPDYTAALNNLATVLQDLGRLEEALAVAERAVAQGDQWQSQALATRNGIRQALQKRQE